MKHCFHCHSNFVAADWTCPACAYRPPSAAGFPLFAPALAAQSESFPAAAFAQLAELEAGNFWFRARNRLIIWALKLHFPVMQRYLEIGCGTGYVLEGVAQAYPTSTVVGSEISCVGLPYAAARVKAAELLQMDARQIPYVEEFDVIGAFDVLEHIEEDQLVLTAMSRALRSGGGVAITVPQHPWLWSAADESACHVRRYKIGELREKVTRAGFRVEFETSFVCLLLPAMLISRLAKRRPKGTTECLPELSLPKWVNRVFGGVMELERYLIEKRWRLKWGGSRLLIATKEQ